VKNVKNIEQENKTTKSGKNLEDKRGKNWEKNYEQVFKAHSTLFDFLGVNFFVGMPGRTKIQDNYLVLRIVDKIPRPMHPARVQGDDLS